MFCDSPFTNMTIRPDGHVFVCCAAWTNAYSLGNAFVHSFEQIWNSPRAQELRASIHDGSFRHCNAAKCGRLAEGELSSPAIFEKNAKLIRNKTIVMETGPEKMTLNYDPSCNLACPSCRKELVFSSSDEIEKLVAFQRTVIDSEYFKNVKRIQATGTGDVFASKVYAHLLAEINEDKHPDVKLELRTNGILLTPKRLEEIKNTHYAIDLIIISIDAATEETYEKVRGKGFNKLVENLAHLGKVKKELGFQLEIWFVMQKENFKEIPDFVHLGKRINADKVKFTRLQNWGTYKNFDQENVFDEKHQQHLEYLKIMQDPILKDPIVTIRHTPLKDDSD